METNKDEIIKEIDDYCLKLKISPFSDYLSIGYVNVDYSFQSDLEMNESSFQRNFLQNDMIKEVVDSSKIRLNDEANKESNNPLLMIYGNKLINSHDATFLMKKKEGKVAVLPLVLFDESFFNIPFGKTFQYENVYNKIKKYSGRYLPVAFSEYDLKENRELFSDYFQVLSNLFKALEYQHKVKKIQSDLNEMVIRIHDEEKNFGVEEMIVASFYIDSIKDYYQTCQKALERIDELISIYLVPLAEIQEMNEKNILQHKRYVKEELDYSDYYPQSSAMKYSDGFKEIDMFTDYINNDDCFSKDDTINEAMDETFTLLKHPCQLGIAGISSLDKTTLINSLLNSEHKLKTSKDVLLTLTACTNNEEEQYKATYKKNIEVDLLKPVVQDEKAKDSEDFTKIEITSEEVIDALLDELSNDYIKNPKLILDLNLNKEIESKEISNKEDIKGYLVKLKYSNTLQYIITKDQLAHSNIEKYSQVKFVCDYDRPSKTTLLDEQEWQNFTDGEGDIYLESPECYLFVDNLDLKMKNDFLSDCHIIDTPGVGSISDDHDKITQNFIEGYSGVLMVLIAVKNNTMSSDLSQLIENINCLCQDKNNTLKASDVLFIFNCYDVEKNNEDALLELCHKTRDWIKELFDLDSNKNFFAFNLNSISQSIESSYEGFGNYQDLKQTIDAKKDSNAMNNFEKIRAVWNTSLDTRINELKDETREVENDFYQYRNQSRKIKDNHDLIQYINLSDFKDYSYDQSIAQAVALLDDIAPDKASSPIRNSKPEVDKLTDSYQRLVDNKEVPDYVGEDFDNKLQQINSYLDDNQKTDISLENSDIDIITYELPLDDISKQYESIKKMRWILNGKKVKSKIIELQDYIIECDQKMRDDIENNYYSKIKSLFDEIKNNIMDTLDKGADNLEGSISQAKEDYENKQDEQQKFVDLKRNVWDNVDKILMKYIGAKTNG